MSRWSSHPGEHDDDLRIFGLMEKIGVGSDYWILGDFLGRAFKARSPKLARMMADPFSVGRHVLGKGRWRRRGCACDRRRRSAFGFPF